MVSSIWFRFPVTIILTIAAIALFRFSTPPQAREPWFTRGQLLFLGVGVGLIAGMAVTNEPASKVFAWAFAGVIAVMIGKLVWDIASTMRMAHGELRKVKRELAEFEAAHRPR